MASDDLDLNDNQKLLLAFAAFTFFMFIILIDDDDSVLCCCTTILLISAVPFAATNSPTKTSNYISAEPSSLFSDELNKDIKQSKKRKPTNLKDMPLEWKQLKDIYPEAELDEYSDYDNFESGNWDIAGLKEDLDIMIKRTGKKPDENIKNNETDFRSLTSSSLRKLLKEKGLSTNGVKAKLIQRLETAQKQSENEGKQVKQQNKSIKQNNGKLDFESMEHSEFKKAILAMNNSRLRKILKSRGLPVTGVKSRLIARLVDHVKEKKETKENYSENNDKEANPSIWQDSYYQSTAKNKKKVNKKVIPKMKVVKPKEEKTTTIECPDCSAIIEIPDVPGMQEVECPECGIKGEIEL